MKRHFTVLTGLAIMSITALTGCGQNHPSVTVAPNAPAKNVVSTKVGTPSKPLSKGVNPGGPMIPVKSNPGGPMIPAKMPLSKLNTGTLNAVSFLSDQVGFVAGKDGIYKTTDGGKTWAQVYTSKDPILGLVAKRNSNGSGENVVAYTKTALLRSTDGRYFKKQVVLQIKDVSILPSNALYAVINGSVFVSKNMNSPLIKATPTTSVSSIAAVNDTTCFAVSGTSVYKTTNRGQHWTKVFTAQVKTSAPWKTQVKAQGNHVAVLFYNGGHEMNQQAYILYESSDAGNTWKPIVDEPYFSVLYPNTKPLNQKDAGAQPGPFVMDGNGDVFMTVFSMKTGGTAALTKIGSSGSIVSRHPIGRLNAPNVFDFLPSGVSSPDGTHIFVVGGKKGKSVIETSNNGGQSFQAQ